MSTATPNLGLNKSQDSDSLHSWLTTLLNANFDTLDNAARISAANTFGASGTLNLAAASDTAGFKLPSKAGAAPTADGALAFDTTTHIPQFGSNGSTVPVVGTTSTQTLTNKTLTAPSLTSPSIASGNLAFGTTAQRITGDFNNATVANRVAFQNSGANANTSVSILPSGSAVFAALFAHGAADPDNAPYVGMQHNGTDAFIDSGKIGTGTAGKMQLRQANAVYVQIDTVGNLALGAQSALATNATSGFVHMRGTTNTPTGVPGAVPTGHFAVNYDSTNHKFWVYDGSWKGVVLS